LLQETTKDELTEIQKQTQMEASEMIDIEKSSIYLSHETEPEFERYMRLLKAEQSQSV